MEKRCPKTIFWLSEKPYKPPKTAKQEAFRWLRDAEAAGSSPVTSTKFLTENEGSSSTFGHFFVPFQSIFAPLLRNFVF